MSNPHYPRGTVSRLLNSEHTSEVTRERMQARLQRAQQGYAPQFFSPDEFALLIVVCARLVPQDDRTEPLPIAPDIDRRLNGNMTNGWRFDTMPPDGEAYKLGLQGLNQTSRARYHGDFAQLDGQQQDAILQAAQNGELKNGVWAQVPSARFFEELLGEAAEIYYGHPDAQDEIGYVGFADVPGWTKIGLNEHEAREPHEEN